MELNQIKHTLLGRSGWVAGTSSSGATEKGASLEQKRGHRVTQLPAVLWGSAGRLDHTQVSVGIPGAQCDGQRMSVSE